MGRKRRRSALGRCEERAEVVRERAEVDGERAEVERGERKWRGERAEVERGAI